MTIKKISVNEFAEQYRNTESKTAAAESIIRRRYVPYLEKVSTLKALLGSALSERDGLHIPDEIALKINFNFAILTLYTNLEIDRGSEEASEAVFRAYDTLQELNIWDALTAAIGEDYEELLSVRRAYLENIRHQNDITVQLAGQATRFGALIGAALKPAADALSRELRQMSDEEKAAFKSKFIQPYEYAKKAEHSKP